MKSEREYFYLPLADAIKSVGIKIHLFALITHFSEPTRCNGTDFVVNLKIIDQSYPAVGITVKCYAEDPANLPNVKSTSDIISLHSVMIKINDGNYYCTYDKRHSSFALFEGVKHGNVLPYQASAKYRRTDHDTIYLEHIIEWSLERKIYEVLTEEPVKMMRIDPCSFFDLICKVIHVSKSSNDEWILYVWDGTDAPPGSQWIQRESLNEEIKIPQVPLQIEETPLPRETLCTFPCVGTVLRVFTKRNFMEIRKLQTNNNDVDDNNNNNGPWIRLCNMTCTMQNTWGIWKGILEPFSKIRILSNEDESVQNRIREYESRIAWPNGRYPWLCLPCFHSVTVTNSLSINNSTLMDSLARKQVPHQIKCIARVVDIYPSQFEYWRSPFDGRYEVRLTLEDPTARIHAHLIGQDAEIFFGDDSEEIVKKKMKSLLGLNDCVVEEGFLSTRDPPWSAFCLKLCNLQKGPSEISKYIVVDTRL